MRSEESSQLNSPEKPPPEQQVEGPGEAETPDQLAVEIEAAKSEIRDAAAHAVQESNELPGALSEEERTSAQQILGAINAEIAAADEKSHRELDTLDPENPDGQDPEETTTAEDRKEIAPLNEEQLATMEAGDDVLELLSFPASLREQQPNIYFRTANQAFNRHFREKQGQSLGETENLFKAFLANIDRLLAVKNEVTAIVIPEGSRPTKAQEKVLAALAIIVSGALAQSQECPPGTLDEKLEAYKNIDPEAVAGVIKALNIKFAGQLEGDQLVSKGEDGTMLIAPTDSNTRNIDLRNIQQQIQFAMGNPESLPSMDMDEDEENEEGKALLEWFEGQGISKETLVLYQRYPAQDAFAIACVYRDQVIDPQKRNQITSLSAEFNLMAKKKPDESYSVSATIENLYHQELVSYRQKWLIIRNSGVDLSQIPDLDDTDIEDLASTGGSDEVTTSTDKTKSGEGSSEKGGTDKSLKTRETGSKSNMPKNLKEAFYNMLGAFDSDILSQLNLPGELVDSMAGGKAA